MHNLMDRQTEVREAGTILLAEDNRVNQRVTTAMLEHLGFRVDVVADGAEAVRAATAMRYRAILMDCQIPVMDGYEATTEIRRLQSPLHTPIIAVTGSDRTRCLEVGMDDHISKPVLLDTLAEVLARCAPVTPEPSPELSLTPDPEPALDLTGPETIGPGAEAERARPVLDEEIFHRLERLADSAPSDFLSDLIGLFVTDGQARVGAMRHELVAGDAEALSRTAHTLHGASANVGASDLADLCADLSTRTASGDLRWSRAAIDAIDAEFTRVCAALSAKLEDR